MIILKLIGKILAIPLLMVTSLMWLLVKVLCAGTFIQVLLEEANSGFKKIIRA